MSERERYLRDLEARLRLRGERRADVLPEIESHIEEGVAAGEDEAGVIARLGEAEQLARALDRAARVPRVALAALLFALASTIAAVQLVGDLTLPRAASETWEPRVALWQEQLRSAARNDGIVFPTPSRRVFERRLRQAATRFDFRVLTTAFVRAPQGAPLVIVETDDPARFSTDVPELVRFLNQRRAAVSLQDWEGWEYEGLFLGAQDTDGEPVLSAFQFWREPGGGQWASREELYPFEHG